MSFSQILEVLEAGSDVAGSGVSERRQRRIESQTSTRKVVREWSGDERFFSNRARDAFDIGS
jgi:hypothetical protein